MRNPRVKGRGRQGETRNGGGVAAGKKIKMDGNTPGEPQEKRRKPEERGVQLDSVLGLGAALAVGRARGGGGGQGKAVQLIRERGGVGCVLRQSSG